MLPTETNALQSGATLAGDKYVIGQILGSGGFGITYQATDTKLNRTVAIKELFPRGSQRHGAAIILPSGYKEEVWAKLVDDFLREARTLAYLDHQAIVTIHDYFEENNTAYIVMKFVEGTNLLSLMQQRGTLPEAEVLRYVAEVGDALSTLHQHGILHRDVKPPNIILNHQGQAVLVDFGAAREFVPDISLTHSVIYTPGYAPPEQMMGRARRGPYTDIYALAATCYCLLTGELPEGEEQVAEDHRLSPQLRAALAHALAFDPKARPQEANLFVAELTGRVPAATGTTALLPIELAPTTAHPAETWASIVLGGHSDRVMSAAFSPNGQRIVTASYDHTARLWDSSGKLVAVLSGHTDWVVDAVFSPDGSHILTSSDDHTEKLWDLSGKALASFDGYRQWDYAAKFSPDGLRIITLSSDNNEEPHLWDNQGHLLAKLTGHEPTFSPDGRFILTIATDNTARLWDSSGTALSTLVGHTSPLADAVFSPDSHHILTTDKSGWKTHLWDNGGNLLTTFQINHNVYRTMFSPNGQRLVFHYFGVDGMELRDLRGKLLAQVSFYRDQGYATSLSFSFSPDWQRFVTYPHDGMTANLWNSQGQLLATLGDHTGHVHDAAFSPDGQRILTYPNNSANCKVKLWDISGQPLATFSGHTSQVRAGRLSSGFSPDGHRIITASADSVRLWSTDGESLATLTGHTDAVNRAVFSHDGRQILTASDDHTARLWYKEG